MSHPLVDPMSEDDLARYSRVLGTLSLDLTRGLAREMGLFVPDEDALRALVREAIVRSRASAEPDPVEIVARLVEEVLSEIRSRFGPAAEEHFVAWERDAFFGEPWRFAQLVRWALLVGREAWPDEAPAPPLAARVRAELSRAPEPDVPRRPESEWDKDYFDRHGHSAHGADTNPMDTVENTIRHVRFRLAFDKAARASADREAEIAELFRWGKREAERQNLGASRLEAPGDWPLPPAPPAS